MVAFSFSSVIEDRSVVFSAGLPDALFSNQKSQVGKNFPGLGLKNVDIFYGHLEHFMDIWDIL
jgi:hypothetical protein